MSVLELCTLPEELLLKIFRYLPERTLAKTAQVSTRLQRISYDPTLWNSVTSGVVLQSKTLCPGTLGFILSRGTMKLQIFNCQFQEPCFLAEPPEDVYKLQYLRVKDYNHNLSDEIQFILSRCKQLKYIILEVPSVSIGHCKAIAENAELEYLNLGGRGLTFAGLLPIVRGCRRLFTLEYGAEVPMSIPQLGTLVEDLHDEMRIVDVFRYNASLFDEHVAAIVKNCPRTTDLNFSGCPNITQASMRHLSRLRRLGNLNISHCEKLPSDAIADLPNMKSFKSLWWSIDFNSD